MKKRLFIRLLIAGTLTLIGLTNARAKTDPWKMVLFDISGDISATDKSGNSELDAYKGLIWELDKKFEPTDTIMIFTEGRYMVPFEMVKLGFRNKFKVAQLPLGSATTIYNALLASLKHVKAGDRVLLITNGIDTGSSIHPHTVSKIFRDKGVAIDVISIYSGPGDITEDGENYYPRPAYDKKFEDISKITNGVFLKYKKGTKGTENVDQLMTEIGKKKPLQRGKSEYDDKLIGMILKEMPDNKLDIFEADTAAIITYLDQKFYGLNEIANYADDKGYIRIGRDRKTRLDRSSPVNYYFSPNQNINDRKQEILLTVSPREDYCKVYEGIPFELFPMIYYPGEGDTMIICGLDFDLPMDDFDFDFDDEGDEEDLEEDDI